MLRLRNPAAVTAWLGALVTTLLTTWMVWAQCLVPATEEPRDLECDQTRRAQWAEKFSYFDSMHVPDLYKMRPNGATADPFSLGASTATFESKLFARPVNYVVWLPPSYLSDPGRRYPVVFFLPGALGSPWEVGSFLQHLRTGIDRGLAPEMIVVGVNAIATPTYYVDAAHGDLPLASVIVEELVPHVDSRYRTLAQTKYRAIEGYSVGGYGALHLALKYPDTFIAATSLAGFVFTSSMAGRATDGTLINKIACNWLNGSVRNIEDNDVFAQLKDASPDTLRGISIRIGYGGADTYPFIETSAKRIRDVLVERGYPPADFIEAIGVRHSAVQMYEFLGPEWFEFYSRLFGALR